ncbi:MAG: hypothetical protein V4795_12605 [Pseudomonadota bacterium]
MVDIGPQLDGRQQLDQAQDGVQHQRRQPGLMATGQQPDGP